MKIKKKIRLIIFLSTILAGAGYYLSLEKHVEIINKTIEVDGLKTYLNQQIKDSSLYTDNKINLDGERYSIDYTVNEKLTTFIKKRIKYYRPDMVAIVVLENRTGKLLSTVGYDRKENSFNDHLPFSGTHPSASIFKIVTTAELFHDGDVKPGTEFQVRGKGTTLYKYQLKEKENARWSRKVNFERAFAFSNNVVFGKAAIENTTPIELKDMAEKLGFNSDLMKEIGISKSTFIMPESGYNLAEIASGFNKDTQMSPVHCALLSSTIANDGLLIYPRLVESLHDKENNIVWNNDIEKKQVIKKEVTSEIRELMRATIDKGTASRKFRSLKKKIRNKLEIGGKTGSITGGFPHGKRDWFTSYAIPEDKKDAGISVCVMNINFKKWYVKSTKLAQEIIQYYYTDIVKLD